MGNFTFALPCNAIILQNMFTGFKKEICWWQASQTNSQRDMTWSEQMYKYQCMMINNEEEVEMEEKEKEEEEDEA